MPVATTSPPSTESGAEKTRVPSALIADSEFAQCQELFAAATGLGLALFDRAGRLVTGPSRRNPAAALLLPRLGPMPEVFSGCSTASDDLDTPGRSVSLGPVEVLTTPVQADETALFCLVAGPLCEGESPGVEALTPLAVRLDLDAGALAAALRQTQCQSGCREEARRHFLAVASLLETHLQERSRVSRREAELTALTDVSARVGSSLNPHVVLQGVLDYALRLLKCRQGSIMLLNDERTELTIAAGRGLDESIIRNVRVPLGEGIAGYVAQTGELKRLRKGFKDRYSQTDDTADQAKAALCVPLRTRNEVIGVLNVSDRLDDGDFVESDPEVLQTLAAQAAAAIANAKLYDATQRKNEQLSALFSLGVAISEAIDKDRDRVLQEVLDRASELCHARKGSLMLREEGTDRLRIVAAIGLPPEIMATVQPRIGEGIAGEVAVTGEPVVLRRGQHDARSQSVADVDSAVCLPLRVGGEVIGVLNVSDKRGEGDFTNEDVDLLSHLAQQAAIAIEKATLQSELHAMFMGTVRALANAIDARDPYTERHSERVAEFSVAMARRLGIDEEDLEYIRVAGLLHDVGKIGIREAILGKPGRLDDNEFREMQTHPVKGARILDPVNVARFRRMLPWMKYHHEKYSARGYPEGLHGDEIPLPARIIAVADTYDAMTSDRPYRKGLPHERAVQELKDYAGEQFDPKVVRAFLECDAAGEIAPIRKMK